MIIVITGTPGTGKTKISNELAGLLNKKTGKKFKVLHLNKEILRRRLWSSADKKRKSKNVDMRKLRKFVSLQKLRNKNLIIESHLAHYFRADVVFVLRTRIKELKRRMERRGWNEAKIEENLEAERLNLILGEALDIHGRKKCIETDTTSKTSKTAAKDMLRKAGLLQ
ncbi:MAG: adenylate kinase family protein [Candidatus Aenigmarchaeota archaeon]|nr:adenylate kinase family protein [Candidatus Aenigmarchaeota archaeon]